MATFKMEKLANICTFYAINPYKPKVKTSEEDYKKSKITYYL